MSCKGVTRIFREGGGGARDVEKCSLLVDRLGHTCTSECYIKVEQKEGGTGSLGSPSGYTPVVGGIVRGQG